MTVTTSGSCLWCQKVVCLVMLKNDLVHKWVFTSLPQIDSTVIYGSNSIVYQSISIPLLRGGGVPNGRGGREHKALKIKPYSTARIATTSPFGYSSPEEEN